MVAQYRAISIEACNANSQLRHPTIIVTVSVGVSLSIPQCKQRATCCLLNQQNTACNSLSSSSWSSAVRAVSIGYSVKRLLLRSSPRDIRGARWRYKKGKEACSCLELKQKNRRQPLRYSTDDRYQLSYDGTITQFVWDCPKLAVSKACVTHKYVTKQIYRCEHMTSRHRTI